MRSIYVATIAAGAIAALGVGTSFASSDTAPPGGERASVPAEASALEGLATVDVSVESARNPEGDLGVVVELPKSAPEGTDVWVMYVNGHRAAGISHVPGAMWGHTLDDGERGQVQISVAAVSREDGPIARSDAVTITAG